MPGLRRKPAKTEALVASAVRLDLRKAPKLSGKSEWQEEAWRHYDRCGELRQAANWMGNSLSRCTIFPADVDEQGAPAGPTTDPRAQAAATGLLGSPSHRAQILQQLGVHLAVPGDCYVIGETPHDELGQVTGEDTWFVASVDELTFSQGVWKLDGGDGARELNIDFTVIIRVWMSHPRKRWEADSPTRAVLPILRKLEQLDQHDAAEMDSRLAGAGILAMSDQVTFPPPSQQALDANPGADPFMLALGEAMMTPLGDRSDASSIVPFIIRLGGNEKITDLITHIDFAAKLTDANAKKVEAAIRRLALGLDMPPEALLGMGAANHWGAWQIEESGIKLNIEPKMTVIVSALNEAYYVPQLEKDGLDPAQFTLWYSTAELAARPDKGPEAVGLWEKGLLKAERALQESGYGTEDAPDANEAKMKLVLDLLRANPGALAAALFPLVGLPTTNLQPAGPTQTPSERVDQADDEPRALPAEPSDEGTPAHQEERTAAQEMAVHALASRAMELVGKKLFQTRLKQRSSSPGSLAAMGVEVRSVHLHEKVQLLPEDLPDLLAGVFTQVPEYAELVGLDAGRLEEELRAFVSDLLLFSQPYTPAAVGAVVRRVLG